MNSAKNIKNAFNSVINQSYMDWEIVVIDKESKDDTIQILKQYLREYPNKIKIYNQKNNGLSNAMNLGIQKSTGELICILGSDDTFTKECFKYVYLAFEKYPKSVWSYGNAFFKYKSKIVRKRKFVKYNFTKLFFHRSINHQTVFVKKEVFNKLGVFNPRYKYSMDYDMILRIGEKYSPIYINKYLCYFNMSGKNITSKFWKVQLKEKIIIMKKYLPVYIYLFSYLYTLVIYIKKYIESKYLY